MQLRHELLRLVLNDLFCLGPFTLTGVSIGIARFGEIVDAVQINARKVANLWVKITRHGEVQYEQGPLESLRFNSAEHLLGNDRLTSASGAHHQIRGDQPL